LLDVETRELVVAEPTVPFDASVLEAVDAGVKLGSELPWVRPGRYALRSWFLTRGPEHLGALSPAIAVTAALPTMFDMGDLTAQVARLADLFADVSPYGLWYENGDQLVDQVRHVLEDEDAPRPRTRTD